MGKTERCTDYTATLNETACDKLLRRAGLEAPASADYIALREAEISRLAVCVDEFLNVPEFIKLMSLSENNPDCVKTPY
jgi:hypothetical protein